MRHRPLPGAEQQSRNRQRQNDVRQLSHAAIALLRASLITRWASMVVDARRLSRPKGRRCH